MMANTRRRRVFGWVLIAIGLVCLLGSLPFLLGGLLALLGVLADVGPDENQRMGVQALSIAVVPMLLGVAAMVAGLLVVRSRPKV